MTDYSKIKTIDELEYHIERLDRRAAIQRKRIEGHVDFVVRQYHYAINTIDAVLTPLRNTINEYRQTIRVVSRIVRAFLPKR